MFFLVVGQLRLSTKTDVPSQSQMYCCVWQLSILFRNRSSSFSVGLPRSACPIVSIVSVFYDQYTLASHISNYRSTIKYIPVTKNTSKFEQLGKGDQKEVWRMKVLFASVSQSLSGNCNIATQKKKTRDGAEIQTRCYHRQPE